MKRRLFVPLGLLLMAALLLCGCAKPGYTQDGLVTVRNEKKDKRVFRIAEVMLDQNGDLNVYLLGTEEGHVCALPFQPGKGGFAWEVYADVSVETADGARLEPVETTPYLNGAGGVVGFRFAAKEMPARILVSAAGYADGGVAVPYAELTLSDAYAVTPTIVELAP